MKHLACATLLAAALAAPAHALLPPPTAEQQAAAAQKKSIEAQKAKEQQEALARVQDRIAARFGKGNAAKAAGPTEKGNLPQKAIEAPRDAGPNGGREQSAEAHSTPAR